MATDHPDESHRTQADDLLDLTPRRRTRAAFGEQRSWAGSRVAFSDDDAPEFQLGVLKQG